MHLITGAAGFIGSHLAHALHAEGAPLTLIDFLPLDSARAVNVAGLETHALFDAASVFAAGASKAALPPELRATVRAVWHMGANSDTTTRNWEHLLHVNLGASQQLWRWCAEHGVPFYYASSAATYGDGAQGFSDRTPPEQLTPLNLYGQSKNDFDAWVLNQVRAGEPAPPHWAGFKFFNVYGARESHKGRMASILWKAERDIATLDRVQLFRSNDPTIADGEQRRDFVWVDDVIAQMRWVQAERPKSDIYNAGTGVASTFVDMIAAFFHERGEEPRIEYIAIPESLSAQYQNFTKADLGKLREAGFSAEPRLPADGVAATLQEIRSLANVRR